MPEYPRGVPLWLQRLRDSPARAEMPTTARPGDAAPGFLGQPGGLPLQHQLPQEGDFALNPTQLDALLDAIWRKAKLFMLPFTVGLAPIQLRPAENRKYFFIQNQHAANLIGLGIAQPPGPTAGVPSSGLIIAANLGFYEPLVVPQDEIWVVGSAAGTPGVIIYG